MWQAIEPVAQGLGSGSGGEFLGGLWILLVSIVSLRSRSLPRSLGWLGLVVGVAGLLSIIPPLSATAYAVRAALDRLVRLARDRDAPDGCGFPAADRHRTGTRGRDGQHVAPRPPGHALECGPGGPRACSPQPRRRMGRPIPRLVVDPSPSPRGEGSVLGVRRVGDHGQLPPPVLPRALVRGQLAHEVPDVGHGSVVRREEEAADESLVK